MSRHKKLAYLRGQRDGIAALYRSLNGESTAAAIKRADEPVEDTEFATWGLQVTGVLTSPYSGRGVRVAVLGTGMDLQHPDFAGRRIEGRSFIAGETVQSRFGYTTHLIGTACGPREPVRGRRYGIAWGAEIFVGKVLSDAGSGTDSAVLAGMNWALHQGCQVILLYVGSDRPPLPIYERIARQCLDQGALLIAAAGQGAQRPVSFGSVASPANCRSVMAVGGVDQRLRMASFSPRSGSFAGGEIDLVGPAIRVYSAFSAPRLYEYASGTSRAAAHVAGIAALWIEATGVTGHGLWQTLSAHAQRLPLPSVDVGAGLVRAPQ